MRMTKNLKPRQTKVTKERKRKRMMILNLQRKMSSLKRLLTKMRIRKKVSRMRMAKV